MSEDNNVGNVSKRLREKRFDAKFRHTENFREYDGEMWNSDDIQFLAFSKKRAEGYDSFKRRHIHYHEIHLSFFGYSYHNRKQENKLRRPITGLSVRICPEQAAALREFLVNKPANETFLLSWATGDYHLSFRKPSLFRGTELRWRFFIHKEEWDKTLFLSRGKRKSKRRDMKLEEERQKLWFTADQSDKLVAYLDSIIPTYTFLQ